MTQRQRQARSDGQRYTQQESQQRIIPAPLAPSRGHYPEAVSGEPAALGREGLFTRLLAGTLEQLLEAERATQIEGKYMPVEEPPPPPPAAKGGRGSQHARATSNQVRGTEVSATSGEPRSLSPSELDERVIALYAKVWTLVEDWQSRQLATIYPIVFLDAIHLKLRRDGKVITTAIYNVLGVDLDGQRDVLGHWVGDGAESANFWLSNWPAILNQLAIRFEERVPR